MENIDLLPLDGAAEAPIIYFDGAPILGVIPGVGRVTLEALVQDRRGDGTVFTRRVVVAHLRGNGIAFGALRSAIEQMELLAEGPPADTKPN
ncbi:hypothetical protein [uncultured Enterovirga sp.]|uniref:hypothetical protein n=1 Tax=uncultured Enterovirga sp. TaxID=2026352 RepID=UPI0035CC47FA